MNRAGAVAAPKKPAPQEDESLEAGVYAKQLRDSPEREENAPRLPLVPDYQNTAPNCVSAAMEYARQREPTVEQSAVINLWHDHC